MSTKGEKVFYAFDYLDRNRGVFVCPECDRDFPTEYPSKSVLNDWDRNSGLARANFERHVNSHKNK